MIRYTLRCDSGHRFESWFYDSASFDAQTERRLLSCPTCGSADVDKAIMAPALVARGEIAAAPGTPSVGTDATDPGERRRLIRALREKILGETRDVGTDFAAEARRIHEGDAVEDRIRGQASLQEARDLLEDGILVLPLPPSPDDLN